ncbi:hypothetical protein [Nocardiopsis tropica]|uniref:Secreted protein/lipoprotein n=1 Tax=Nocardiopsis tropica TaxID=109330 RepID=A0ABU7KMT7_9ACTN|nr:hypothetical protein [Nocardiopsis umidischolae]MEE2050597.1 hypothetical protein [Nocardiopsis umidischolae]
MRVPLAPEPSSRPWLGTGVVLSAALLGLTACSTAPAHEDTPVDPSPSIDSAQAEAVLETYRSAREVYIDLLQGELDMDTADEQLKQYATGQAYDSMLQDGTTFGEADIAFEGEPGMDPQVTGLDMDSDPPSSVLTDCWDDSSWHPVQNGQTLEAAPDQDPRRVLNVRAQQQDGAWVLVELSPEEGRTC